MSAAARFHRIHLPSLHRVRRPGGPRGLESSHVLPVVLVAALALAACLARVLGSAPDSLGPAMLRPVATAAAPTGPEPYREPTAMADDAVPEMPSRAAEAISL